MDGKENSGSTLSGWHPGSTIDWGRGITQAVPGFFTCELMVVHRTVISAKSSTYKECGMVLGSH